MTVSSDTTEREVRFARLVEAHSDDLYRYAYWLCRRSELAQDLVQETWLRAWRSLDNLREPAAAKAWLATTLRREHARLYEKVRPEGTDEALDSLPTVGLDSDHRTEAWALRKALAQLADDYREPLVLQVLGGYSCDEIGVMLGLTPQTVMTRVFRARRQLRGLLSDDANPAPDVEP